MSAEKSISHLLTPDLYWNHQQEVINVLERAQKIMHELYIQQLSQREEVKFSGEDLKNKNIAKIAYDASLKIYRRLMEKDYFKTPLRDYAFECINQGPSLHITIAISGWLSQGDEMNMAWKLLSDYAGQGETYALRWDSNTADNVIKKDVVSMVGKLIGLFIFPAEMLIPIVKTVQNHTFKQSAKQAEITGIILANLIEGGLFGNATISLVGFSLGTRVIYSCLLELAKLNSNKIHDVILLGGAAPLNLDNWKICRSIISGRLVNTYSKSDKILSVLYTFSIFEKPIGNYEISVDGIENFNVTDIASGHARYREVLDKILNLIKYNT